jgi:hypothetical protein
MDSLGDRIKGYYESRCTLTPELEEHLDKLVKLIKDETYDLFQLSSSYNNYIIDMVLEGDEVLVTLIDYKGDIEHRLTIHGVVHHAHK